MRWIKRIVARMAIRMAQISGLKNPEAWLENWLAGSETASGVRVTEWSTLTIPAAVDAVRYISQSVGSLPFITYKRLPRGKQRAPEHRLHRILHDEPNPFMSSMIFRETLQNHLLLWGNAYAEIQRDKAGRVVALWPIHPSTVSPEITQGKLLYKIQISDMTISKSTNQQVVLLPHEVLHIPGLSFDGIVGISPITLARQTLGLSIAAEEFGARFYKNAATPAGVLLHPGVLGPEARENLTKSWGERHTGLANAHRLAILEEGMKFVPMSVPQKDAEYLESRKFQVIEVARIFNVPPHKIKSMDRATFSNIEQQSIESVTDTLVPWLTRWEQEVNRKLFKNEFFAEFLVDGLLRGDSLSRFKAYQIGRFGGWMSANDVRERENMNPIEGGDEYLRPANMVPIDDKDNTPPPGGDDGDNLNEGDE